MRILPGLVLVTFTNIKSNKKSAPFFSRLNIVIYVS